MSYDYINAINCGTDIITMQAAQINKMKMFSKNLEDYSLETVMQFFNDAKDSGFEIK
jgi:transaldolase